MASGHRSLTSQMQGIPSLFAICTPATMVSGWTLDARITSGFPNLAATDRYIRNSPR